MRTDAHETLLSNADLLAKDRQIRFVLTHWHGARTPGDVNSACPDRFRDFRVAMTDRLRAAQQTGNPS